MVGRVPPPHLSPFVDNEAEGYVPEYAETIKQLQAAAGRRVLPLPDLQSLLAKRIIDRREANEADEHKKKMELLEKQYHDDDPYLESQGITYSASLSTGNSQTPAGETEVEGDAANELDQVELSKICLSRKQRGVMEAIQIGEERKKDKIEVLEKRNKKVEANKSG